MRRLMVQEFATLDGVVEEPGDWQLPFVGDDHLTHVVEVFRSAEALLLGRKTYEGFAEAWPSRTGLQGLADRMNSMPKYVASRTLRDVEWNATLLDGDAVEAVAALKQQDGGDLLLVGSVALAHELTRHDLIDVYQLWIHPIVVGAGNRMFPGAGEHLPLELTDLRQLETGVVILTYERDRRAAP